MKDVLQKLVGIQQREWLDKDENADHWYGGKRFSAKENRILISHWAGEACDQFFQPKYDHLKLKCWPSTHCLSAVDGSDDLLAKPEDLPPGLLLECCSTTIILCVDQRTTCSTSALCSGDKDNTDENENSVPEQTEFVAKMMETLLPCLFNTTCDVLKKTHANTYFCQFSLVYSFFLSLSLLPK